VLILSKLLKSSALLLMLSSLCSSGACTASSADKHFHNAMEFRFAGLSDAAISEYRRGLALKPDAADAHAQLGALLLDEKGDLDGAISELVTALGIDPNCQFCDTQLGQALSRRNSTSADQIAYGNKLYSSGDLKRAMAAYRVAISLNSKDGTAHNSLAWTLYRLGQLDEGLAEVKEALRLKPEDPEFVNTLASLLFDKGDLAGAAQNFKKAISLVKNPNPADLYGLAVVAVSKGDTTAAAKLFGDALKIDPKYDDPQYLRDRIGMSARTLSSHERLLSLMPRK